MPEVRMSLDEAAKLLGGLHVNSVRARAKSGKIPYERDNSGKWWVFLDPEKAAEDAKDRAEKKAPKKVTMEAPLEASMSEYFKPLEVTIQAISQELEVVRAERDTLRARADDAARLEGEVRGLRDSLSMTESALVDTRARLDQEISERRKLTEIIAEMARPAPTLPAEAARRGWLWRIARKAKTP